MPTWAAERYSSMLSIASSAGCRAARTLLDLLLHLGASRADERELRRHEEAVREHQHDQQDEQKGGHVSARAGWRCNAERASASQEARVKPGRSSGRRVVRRDFDKERRRSSVDVAKVADQGRPGAQRACFGRLRAARRIPGPCAPTAGASGRRRSRRRPLAAPDRPGPAARSAALAPHSQHHERRSGRGADGDCCDGPHPVARVPHRGELPVRQLVERDRLHLGERAPRARRRARPAARSAPAPPPAAARSPPAPAASVLRELHRAHYDSPSNLPLHPSPPSPSRAA